VYLNSLLQTVGMKRESVYITNFVQYQPPGNRDPEGEEISISQHLLRKELEILKPRVVVTLGRFAAGIFWEFPHMATLAGSVHRRRGYTVFPMYHPAAALYDTTGDLDGKMRLHIKMVANIVRGVAPTALVKQAGSTTRPAATRSRLTK
jgi:uracil-DNA glycosylase family 4